MINGAAKEKQQSSTSQIYFPFLDIFCNLSFFGALDNFTSLDLNYLNEIIREVNRGNVCLVELPTTNGNLRSDKQHQGDKSQVSFFTMHCIL